MNENEPGNRINRISEEVEVEFEGAVQGALEINPFAITQPLKYKVGSRVWVRSISPLSAEIKRGSAGIYILKFDDGKYLITPRRRYKKYPLDFLSSCCK